MLPNFLIIGSMKSATTSLWSYLRQHPDVFLPEEKEPDFFIEDRAWGRGLDWYESLFAGAEDIAARGEASVNYTKAHVPSFRGVPERIATVLPDAKLIYIMRHPLERMISHYLHMRATGQEKLPAERALVEHPAYFQTSRYAWQLEGYLERFPSDRLLLLTSESLRDHREATLARIHMFLGVKAVVSLNAPTREHATADKSIRVLTAARVEKSPVYRGLRRVAPAPAKRLYHRVSMRSFKVADVRIPDRLREQLTEKLRPEVAALRPLMPDDFDGWGIA